MKLHAVKIICYRNLATLAALISALLIFWPSISLAVSCGDGIVDSGEWCDDGNKVDGDGCSSECELECIDTECPTNMKCTVTGICEECTAHCDCPQGSFCYYGKCLTDPKTPVYCCAKIDSCPPGRWCFEPDGGKGTCGGYLEYICETACDCGAAHACKKIPGMDGKRCVKDTMDPWNPGGTNIFKDLGVEVVQGEDATYSCGDPLCHAGMHAYGSSDLFRCWYEPEAPGVQGLVRDSCSGTVCRTGCDCDPGQSCVDIYDPPLPPMGKVCDWEYSLNPAE
jgi:cysteine-rich repeat protein